MNTITRAFLHWQNARKTEEHKTGQAKDEYNKARALLSNTPITKEQLDAWVAEKKEWNTQELGQYGSNEGDYEAWCEWLDEYRKWVNREQHRQTI